MTHSPLQVEPPGVVANIEDGTQEFGFRQKFGLVFGPLFFIAVMAGLTRAGLQHGAAVAAATVALMSTWWITESYPLWVTASLPVVIFPVAGVAPVFDVVIQYFDPINFLFLGGMLIAGAMEEWGLHRRIALNVIARIGTSPRRIVLGFMLATTFITLWISNTATAVMMYPIAMAVLLRFEEESGKNDPLQRRFGMALMLGIAYASSIGGIGTKIGTGPNLVFVKLAWTELKIDIDFLTWLKLGLPVVFIATPLVWLYLVRIVAPLPERGFESAGKAILEARGKLGRMHLGEVVALVAFVTAALAWIFRNDMDFGSFKIPGWWKHVTLKWEDVLGYPVKELKPASLAKLLGQDIGDAVVGMTIGCALLLIPVQGRPLKFALPVRRAVFSQWDLLILLGGGFAMAYGIQRSGLSGEIAQVLKGVGKLHPFVATLLVCLVTTALTEVASNVATANIILPLLAVSAESFGLQPAPLMFAATMSATFGFMLPAGTPPNAVVFASGYIPIPVMAKSGLVIDICGAFLIATVCYFLGPWALGN